MAIRRTQVRGRPEATAEQGQPERDFSYTMEVRSRSSGMS